MESEEWCGGEMVRGTATRDSDNLRDCMCHCVCSFGMIFKTCIPITHPSSPNTLAHDQLARRILNCPALTSSFPSSTSRLRKR